MSITGLVTFSRRGVMFINKKVGNMWLYALKLPNQVDAGRYITRLSIMGVYMFEE